MYQIVLFFNENHGKCIYLKRVGRVVERKNINMFKGTTVPGHIFLISKTGYFIKGLIKLSAID